MQCILLAPPGIPVSQHGAALAAHWQVPHVSMAALLQGANAEEPVSDEQMLKRLRRRLEQPDAVLKGWVLEGFPRSLGQAQGLADWCAAMGLEPARVVYLKAMTGILINRLTSQLGASEPVSAIRRRLEQHQAEVEPLLEFYQGRNQLGTVNASVSFAEVARELATLGQDSTGAAPLIPDESQLDTLIASQPKLVVDCMAVWCDSCKRVSPSIDKLAEEYCDRIQIMKIDFDANRQISKRFGLKGIPSVMFFKDGQLQATLTGVKSYAEYHAAATSLLEG